jgi:translation initiation factor 1
MKCKDITFILFMENSPKIHIRLQQRNGRKCITLVQGLAPDMDIKKILRCLMKAFHCHGTVISDEIQGDILQLAGDQRVGVVDFLVEQEVCLLEQIIIHG